MSIVFEKYDRRGAYHWVQASSHPLYSNANVKARYAKCVRLLNRALNGLENKRVLDLGCGDGFLTYKIFQKGAIVTGVDSSNRALALAETMHRERGSTAVFFARSGYDVGFEDNHFNGVVCSDVIEHVDQPEALLKEILRVLKPGGAGIISTPIRYTEKPLDQMHVVEWFQHEFQNMVGDIFPAPDYHVTHPLFWGELLNRHILCRIAVNIFSFIHNPFLSSRGWRYYAMQYAVVRK